MSGLLFVIERMRENADALLERIEAGDDPETAAAMMAAMCMALDRVYECLVVRAAH